MGARVLNRILTSRYIDEIKVNEIIRPKKMSSNSIMTSI